MLLLLTLGAGWHLHGFTSSGFVRLGGQDGTGKKMEPSGDSAEQDGCRRTSWGETNSESPTPVEELTRVVDGGES